MYIAVLSFVSLRCDFQISSFNVNSDIVRFTSGFVKQFFYITLPFTANITRHCGHDALFWTNTAV